MCFKMLLVPFLCCFCLVLTTGCSDKPGPAAPASSMSEIEQFLQDNPEENVDDVDAEMEEDDEGEI